MEARPHFSSGEDGSREAPKISALSPSDPAKTLAVLNQLPKSELPAWARKPKRGKPLSEYTLGNNYKVDSCNVPLRWQQSSARTREKEKARSMLKNLSDPGVKKYPFAKVAPESKFGVTMVAEEAPTSADVAPLPVLAVDSAASKPWLSETLKGPTQEMLEEMERGDEEERPELPSRLAPEEVIQIDESSLPLDIFDTAFVEKKTPEEWVMGESKGRAPYFINGQWKWKPCEVLGYDAETKRYRIKYTQFFKEKNVKRINLCFDEEDQDVFQERLRTAMAAREAAKAQLRLKIHLEALHDQSVAALQSTWERRITNYATANGRISTTPVKTDDDDDDKPKPVPLIDLLLDEVRKEYIMSCKRSVLLETVKQDREALELYKLKRLPELPPPDPIVEYGKVDIPQPDQAFEDLFEGVNNYLFIALPEVIGVLQWKQAIFLQLAGERSLMDVSFRGKSLIANSKAVSELRKEQAASESKKHRHRHRHRHHDSPKREAVTSQSDDIELPCTLELFNRHQQLVALDTEKVLNMEWRRGLIEHITDDLPKWFNFFESDHDMYLQSAAFRFLRMMEIRMCHQLRGYVAFNLDQWVQLLASYSPAAEDDFERLGDWCTPLLKVKLVVKDGDVTFDPSKEEICDAFLAPIERMAKICSSILPVADDVMSLQQLEQRAVIEMETGQEHLKALDAHLKHTRQSVSEIVERCLDAPLKLAAKYAQYSHLLQLKIPDVVNSFVEREKPCTNDEWRDGIAKFYNASQEVLNLSADEEKMGLVTVQCDHIKIVLSVQGMELAEALMVAIQQRGKTQLSSITDRYESILSRVSQKPRNEKELDALKTYLAESKGVVANLEDEVGAVHVLLDMLGEFFHALPEDDFLLSWSVKEWPLRVADATQKALTALEHDKVRMMDKLEKEKEQFEAELTSFTEQVKAFESYGDWDQLDKIVDMAAGLDQALTQAQEQAKDFNEREEVFGWKPTPYTLLEQLQRDFEPFCKLWMMSSDFKSKQQLWLTGPFLELNAAVIEKDVNEWWTMSYRLMKQLATVAPGPSEVAAELRRQTDAFKANVPVIQALASAALKERHWVQLSKLIGGKNEEVNLVPDEELTLHQLVDMNVAGYWEEIEQVTTVAEKEWGLERALDAMINEWTEINFETIPYKTTGTYVIKSVEDTITLLDDHIVKTQTMLGSQFIKPIQKRCKVWEKKLQYCQNLIDEWLMCQRTWLYLEPIFASEDIMRQMPVEGRRFKAVDGLWRSTMNDVFEEPRVMDVANKDGLCDKFKEANKRLDQIQKGLNDYLEIKRLAFPRFYFLSNDELLEILSQTKEPRAVQPFLVKCFEGISRVVFSGDRTGNAEDLAIVTMISGEGENVELINPVDTNKGQNKGNAEFWLLELQGAMRVSVKDVVKKAIEAYPKCERNDWILRWPGQVILCVSSLYWTQDVTRAIKEGALAKYSEHLCTQLLDIVELVRGNLTKLDRLSLGALCVVDVHARDVVGQMVKEKVADEEDFNWMAQLRYYWEDHPDDYNRYGDDPFNMMPRIVNATVMYGYEYLGNSTRLVITPLTDRCYRTIMGAVSLMYGGAPAGPAGTGKTETVKDLSKAVAIQCVVFNCSDGLDYLAMAKFFKGLAASGAWSCFDEFNRIELEVLSVIAQQLLTILKAKRARAQKFMFEGSNLPLNPDCNSFITMNPGYAGRSELPDNLKALFRPCAMMVPDYALIAEIKLYSFGFTDARNMARKVVQVLRLCSEQLSSQKHYDYGMRAVFSILVRAGDLRQLVGDKWAEDLIVLSSINDVNLPKFTTNDLPLFKGITSDLFPGVALPTPDYGELIPTIRAVARDKNLQEVEPFIKATVQLYETVLVRHGLMVVGETFSGKTNVIHTLAKAMSTIKDNPLFVKTEIHSINPKSVTQGQLYGNFDENTHEWTDGVLAVTFRHYSKDDQNRHWILFDGPVDAVWIENMNTVLDDNKKLCLMSGEIVKMSPTMTMMFEAEDLEEASPATVSRVGMVYMEQVRLGWFPLLESYLNAAPEIIKSNSDLIMQLYNWLMPVMLFFVEKDCKVPVPITFIELMASSLRMFESLVDEPLCGTKPQCKPSDVPKAIEGCFLQAIIWSLGVAIDDNGREMCNDYIRVLCSGKSATSDRFQRFLAKSPSYKDSNDLNHLFTTSMVPPESGSVYDFYFSPKTCKWQNWMTLAGNFRIGEDVQFTSIVVPTIDTIRNGWTIDLLLNRGIHVMCTGPTGTGKSVGMVKKLLTEVDANVYQPVFLNFSAQTSANMSQDIIDAKLKKRRRGVFGPPLGKKCIVFVDDLNMPAKEKYGAQPPIELLRQFMCQGGWYDRKECTFRKLQDVQFVTAMGPPGGGRTRITQRYVRHFNVLGFSSFDNESLVRIFGTIMEWALGGFSAKIKGAGKQVVAATIDMFTTMTKEMLPTPTKSHYTFNLRDLAKVFQGISAGSPDRVKETNQMIRLWVHECKRVFRDRLVTLDDSAWLDKKLAEKVKVHFKCDWNDPAVKGGHDVVLFGNFIQPQATVKHYAELDDRDLLKKVMAEYLEDFNATNRNQMHLVLFMNAVEHVSRISRIICQPYGNALLVGVGGSGRKSLTKLAVFMADYELFQVEIAKGYGRFEWREDMKRMLRLAGLEGKQTVFLFSDTQIVLEAFVEDVNNILNTGEVPNLFETDELAMMIDELGAKAALAGKNPNEVTEVYSFFVERCRTNLHVVLAFSPIGDAFRRRLRMFPSLVNCCTIDWFTEWPEDALRSVGGHFLDESVMLEPKVKEGVIDICVDMQSRVTVMSTRYRQELRRYYYVTPTSYLELINTFKSLISEKRDQINEKKSRYENGLTKLLETADQVEGMQVELEALKPKLKEAQVETNEMLVTIEEMQKQAKAKQDIVAIEAKECGEQAASASAMKAECESDLAEALPALAAAVKALDSLTKSDIVEVKSMKKPPGGVKLTMEACCVMLKVKPKKVPAPDGRGKIDDYWEPAQKQLLGDTKFLTRLKTYDKDSISDDIVTKVSPYVALPEFDPDVVKNASKAAWGLCKWIHAMIVYNRVAKVVAPKKESLRQATALLQEAESALAVKRAELKDIVDRVAQLEEDLKVTLKKKDDLQAQVTDVSNKLDRAQRLIGGLGGERVRWTQLVNDLRSDYNNVVGDVLLSSGMVAYLGVFTNSYREECVQQWSTMMKEMDIPRSPQFDLVEALGEPVAIREWTINKLPNDAFSICNAIMLTKSNRWPLMIDPQGQANRWIRNMEGANGLKVVKQTQATFVRTLENSVQFGRPILLENVPENIDPILESVLTKQVVKVGGQYSIKIGDNMVEYDKNFKLYITTKLRNPHYPPETCVKVNLLNFVATPEGLEDQMLGITVRQETPELEEQREKLVLEDAANKRQLKEIEDEILTLMAASEGNILDDELLINTLAKSKKTSNQIMEQVKVAEATQKQISATRQGYVPVARRAANLFFCIADLANVDPMYQYSLEWYINLFLLAFKKGEMSPVLEKRLKNLNDSFTEILYVNVCRSLFEKDKLLFSFLLCTKILLGKGTLDPTQLRYLLQGSTSMDLRKPNPCKKEPKWLSDKMWADILDLSLLPAFKGFEVEFERRLDRWKSVYNSQDPTIATDELLASRFGLFQRLLVVRCIRPDFVIPLVQKFVSTEIGETFIDPPPFDLKACYADSHCASPLIFVLSPGADPMSELLKLADKMGVGRRLQSVSLGQGQGPIAEAAVSEAVDKGTWVCLQNCHLAESWMSTLEKLCEDITPENTHVDFRLFLTSMPSPKFPVSVLQNGVKMTMEPPKGMRASLQGSYNSIDKDWFEECGKPKAFKKLLFGLCFFHATVRERRKFGPLGWNIPYEFSEPDLKITMDQLRLFLDTYDEINYDALSYLAGECNYGGRVTDDKDRRLILNILSDFYTPDAIVDGYVFSPSKLYYPPEDGRFDTYLEYIKQLPYTEQPEVFGMHDNANITCAMQETNSLLETALSLQPRSAGGAGKSWDAQLLELAGEISSRMPPLFDVEKVALDFPVVYTESMNTVLTQELLRFNRLLDVVKSSLVEIQRAIKGEVVMSQDLENLGNSMVVGYVPEMWKTVAYPSLKPLGSWVTDLLARLQFLRNWIDNGVPITFWISGFFFTQSFLTGTRQNFARKYTVPIDTIEYDFSVLSMAEGHAIKDRPADGAYVHGLFLEGANWDDDNGYLSESRPKELYVPMPVIWLLPSEISKIDETRHVYDCPTYKTSERRGMLSTTGHSTNFVILIRLPMNPKDTEKHWIKRGVAMLTQLDE